MTVKKLFFSSLVASMASFVIVFAILITGFPVNDNSNVWAPDNNAIIFREDLEKSSSLASEEIKRKAEEYRARSFAHQIKPVHKLSVYFSWIPWFFLPIVLSLKMGFKVLGLLAVPLLMTLLGFFGVYEFLLFGASLLVGMIFSGKLRRSSGTG